MDAIAVIAEFNPFHTGHAYLLSEIRRQSPPDTAVIVILSGALSSAANRPSSTSGTAPVGPSAAEPMPSLNCLPSMPSRVPKDLLPAASV